MKISYTPGFNFHNSSPLSLLVSGATVYPFGAPLYVISEGQAKRIEKHFCGMSSCGCPKGEVIQMNPEGTQFSIPVANCEVL